MGNNSKLLYGLLLVLVLLVILYVAWDRCWILAGTRYGKKGCIKKLRFCGADPDPGAMSEAMGLYELGVRPSEGFRGSASSSCGTTPSPAALAEAQGLMQMGWRPEHMRTRPSCAKPSPAAIIEAQSLQSAQALAPTAPYYEKFHGTPSCGSVSREAAGEARLLDALQATDIDKFAAQKVQRDRAAFSSTQIRRDNLRTNPNHTTARHARFNSMSEGFGGPDKPGYGWAPSEQEGHE
jgi:hypothetical protein